MKNTIPLFTVAAALVLLGAASQSNAQYRPTGEDGIAASPKVRQFLDERNAAAKVANSSEHVGSAKSVGYKAVGDDSIAASPRVRQFLAERKAVPAASTERAQIASSRSVGYRATGDDGITASPKLRQILNDRNKSNFQIAPLK